MESARREAGLRHRVGLSTTSDPLDDLWKVLGKAGLCCGTVQLAKNAAPEPTTKLRTNAFTFSLLTEDGKDACERNELSPIGKISWREEVLAHEEASSLFVASNG